MNSIALFLLKSLLVSGALTTWYWLALRDKRLNNYNRFFLLFTLYASIQVPLLHFQWFTFYARPSVGLVPSSFFLHVLSYNGTAGSTVSKPETYAGINWSVIAFAISGIISAVLLAIFFIRIVWLVWMSRKYPVSKIEGMTFINTDLPSAPFSFLTWLFWKDNISPDSEDGRLIFEHEMTHIKQKHTYDKLACQLLTCVCWFNPFYWLIQKELGMVHEFIADEKAIDGNDTGAFARMLLQAHYSNSYLVPEHQFFSSPVKRRLIMLQTTRKIKHSALRRMMVLPIAAGAVLIFSFSPPKEKKNIERADHKIVLVLDPGHGGTDIGSQYEAIREKDINLKIANRIKELSPQYNIETHLTRNGDETLSLPVRVNISNKLRPDDFISVHVTDDSVRDMRGGNFDIDICFENPRLERSKELGWAVFQHLNAQGGIQKQTPAEKRLYVLRHNNAASILIEFGDIKSKEKMQWITDDTKLDELCGAVLAGVVESHKK